MESGLIYHFAETLAGFISHESLSFIRLFRHMLKDMSDPWKALPDEFSGEMIKEHLFMSVTRDVAEKYKKEDIQINPEETMATLIRHGISKDRVSATYRHLEAKLPNASYRIFRRCGGYPAGTLSITRNKCSVYVRPELVPEELVQFMLQLDSLLPEIDEAAEALFEELLRMLRKKQAENMALEIARRSVESQLADILPKMGITGKFEISDGTVRLNLRRIYMAEIELPLGSLQDFLSNPERIEAALELEPVSPTPEARTVITRPFSPARLFSKITVKP